MNILPFLAGVEAPGGLWSILINWFHSGILNFGWTIFLLVIAVKLITSPLDFFTKLSTKKQSLIQQKCAPQIAKIQKKFGANQQAVRTQTNELYKKEGLNSGAGCIIMLVNMVLTLVIFFTFFSSLRANSAYQAINQYEILENTYNNKAVELLVSKNNKITEYEIIDQETAEVFLKDFVKGRELANPELNEENQNSENTNADNENTNNENQEGTEIEEPSKTNEEYIAIYNKYSSLVEEVNNGANDAVIEKWHEIKSDWLWVANIWVSDSPMNSPFLTYNGLVSMANSGGKAYSTYVAENIDRDSFTAISNVVNTQGGRTRNGYFILAGLAAIVTFLAQYIAELHNKLKNKKAKQLATASMEQSMNSSMKYMKYIMPVIMIIFVLQSSASFGIYILSSNIASIAFGEISNLIIKKLTYKKQIEVEEILEKEANRQIKKGKLQEKRVK